MRKTKLNPLDPRWHETIVDLHCEEIEATAKRNRLPLPRFDDCIIDQETTLGCGEYGCAFECGENCVMKLTTDSTEAHFVSTALALGKQESGIIHFKSIYAIPEQYNGMPVLIFWREKALSVGIPEKREYDRFATTLGNNWKMTDTLFEMAFRNLQSMGEDDYWDWLNSELKIVKKLMSGEHAKTDSQFANLLYGAYRMAGKVAESPYGKEVGQALQSLMGKGLILCDVHLNNVGTVERNGETLFVVTDTGHSLVLDRRLQNVKIPIIGQE